MKGFMVKRRMNPNNSKRIKSMKNVEDQKHKRLGISYAEVVPWGRSFDEYLQMFLLSEADLNKSIVGVADGPASSITRA